MSNNTRIRGACKLCKGSSLFYGGGSDKPTGVWCIGKNGRVKHPPKEPKDCKWFKAIEQSISEEDAY